MNEKTLILAIDDNPSILNGVCRILRSAGYETIQAGTGLEGIGLAQSAKPDLILADVVLPDIDGYEVCKRIKSIPGLSDTFVVLISSMKTDSEHQSIGLEIGADGYIARPVSNRELLARVESLLRIKLAEKALKESELKFRTVANFTYDWEYWLDPKGAVRFMSPSCERVTGHSPSEFIANPELIHEIVHPEDKSLLADNANDSGSNELKSVRFRIFMRDGECRWIEQYSLRVYDDDQEYIGIRVSNRDITERVLAQQEAEFLQRKVFQSQKMATLGTLVGGIAHDFNNMLQIIRGYSELLLMDGCETDSGHLSLKKIISTTREAAEIVSKLLAFSQQSQIIPRPVDLNLRISELSQVITKTLPNPMQLEMHLSKDPLIVDADISQIDQLLMNLAINASEVMPTGGVATISTRRVLLTEADIRDSDSGASPGDYALLTFSDNGPGIDKDTLPLIFDPFFSTKQRGSQKGMGLGLSVVRGIAMQHNGFVTCESKPGHGAQFKVYLPAVHGLNPVSEKVAHPDSETALRKFILVIESNLQVVEMEQKALELIGHSVITATDPAIAVEIFEQRHSEIRLVILDYNILDKSRRDCLSELVSIDPSARILLVGDQNPISGLGDEHRKTVAGFLQKPFGMTDLLDVTRSIL